ncbi:hypothetical protein HF521_019865 [Silurus meridionalis]|uniref:Chemokine interleukin-8-like domain-containing protein n=1 Tax=Silurus meridionalis TaxID=175797 RepID=A0A8T0BHF6_SILME|nr:hypothetical protein HF521_019865 [Silurus meridionalis]
MKRSALAITALACALLSMTEGLLIQPRCRCTGSVQKPISDDSIVKMEKFKPGPHCKNVEIIATVKFEEKRTLCFDPNAEWVQDALKRYVLDFQVVLFFSSSLVSLVLISHFKTKQHCI